MIFRYVNLSSLSFLRNRATAPQTMSANCSRLLAHESFVFIFLTSGPASLVPLCALREVFFKLVLEVPITAPVENYNGIVQVRFKVLK